MEAFFGVLLILGVVIWLLVRDPKGGDRPAPRARAGPVAPQVGGQLPASRPAAGQPLPAALPATPSLHDDAAFFDGYVWGRLQERHDERQHDYGHGGGHDHDMYDADDGYDDHS